MAIAQPAAAAPRTKAKEKTRAARGGPGTTVISIIVTLSIAVVLVLLYALWKFWPTEAILATSKPQPVHIFGITRDVSTEIRLFVIVAISGALGGLMHSTRSVAWYVGHGGLRWRWIPYYVVTIVLGAGLASVFYLVVRGGVLNGKATSGDVNPYGFAAIAALVGLFTEEALNMLKRVAQEIFAEPTTGADGADQFAKQSATAGIAPPAVTQTTPASGVTATSATLEGDAVSDGEPPSYHFDYGPTTGYGQMTDEVTSDAAAAHVTASINGLTPVTDYHFRIVVTNANGQWTTGSDMLFTTPAG